MHHLLQFKIVKSNNGLQIWFFWWLCCAVLPCGAEKGIYLNPSDLGSRKQKDTFENLRKRGRGRGRGKGRGR